MADESVNRKRRRLLVITSGLGAIGAGFASIPFIASMTPSARARAMGAPVEADISKLEPGQLVVWEWRGQPVWIVHRTAAMLEALPRLDAELADPESQDSIQPVYTQNQARSIRPEILVLVGICTHLGCSPLAKLEPGVGSGLGAQWPGGFFCPCHGSLFDLAGRVYKNVPAPTNLVVPPHKYLSDTRILIGVDSEGVA